MTAVDNALPLGFDPLDPSFLADPYPHYRHLRENAPMYRSSSGLWVATRHADCTDVVRDSRLGRPAEGERDVTNSHNMDLSFLSMDPPDHTRLRRLVSKAFTAKVVSGLQPRVQQLVDELLDRMRGQREVDLISAFAHPLPVRVISEMLGVPYADHERFAQWSDALGNALGPGFLLTEEQLRERMEAKAEFDDYFRGLIAARRREPAQDLLSELVMAEENGDSLTEQELVDILALLLVAGHETTVNLIGNGTLALLRHRDQFEYLRDNPDRAADAVEELLRYDSPVQTIIRYAHTDIEIGGHRVAGGEGVVALVGAANHDPTVFTDPDRLDLTRSSVRHLSFGQGIHFCLGAPLARLEGRLALACLVRALPAMELLDADPPRRKALVLRGLTELRVRCG
ncbi:MAG: cytochrome P450 [Kutzneria sp.]|nr:cytochrome P450 [Kutzneria sp.]MBV9844437.1 cytochrome P450 [Kutzneria sp.]